MALVWKGGFLVRRVSSGLVVKHMAFFCEMVDLVWRGGQRKQTEAGAIIEMARHPCCRYGCSIPRNPLVNIKIGGTWVFMAIPIWIWVKVKPPGNGPLVLATMFPLPRATHFGVSLFFTHRHLNLEISTTFLGQRIRRHLRNPTE